ncbi:translation initiation factor IF-2 [Candidatus Kaiserbacteria bacterium]|nr:translation initiation factor IF-2 [Candidatus Kaiserbacteria bacterium]
MEQKKNNRTKRAPVIVVMGHVDHGKSTLLDYIRKTNVVAGEAGGITQRISAYEVIHKDREGNERKITFLDTPGHESFSKMRSRGSKVADIAVLVVSAEEGVKPQTIEAYKAITESGIPCIVAINKIDRPGANVEKTKNSLVEHNIYLEGLGGEIPWVAISAKSGQGIEELLDMMLLVADLAELSGNTDMRGEGVVIEAHRDTKEGISATLLIKEGSIKKGMFVNAGKSVAPVRMMEDFSGKRVDESSFSSPVRLVGFNSVPHAGERFTAHTTKKEAEEAAKAHVTKAKDKTGVEAPHATEKTTEKESIPLVPIILRADAQGSIEAIEHEIGKIKHDRVEVRVVQKTVGDVSEGDVKLALGSPLSIVLGFNVGADSAAKDLAERHGIQIHTFDIIYKLAEWLEKEIRDRTPHVDVEESTGRAIVLKIFNKTKNKQVVGGRVDSGKLKVGSTIQIIRRDNRLGTGTVINLEQRKLKVKEVEEGNEFGAQIESRIELSPKDVIESFVLVKK